MNFANNTNGNVLGMAWYKFLIYFSLIAGAILNIIMGLNYITGSVYFIETNGMISAEQVYEHYGIELQVIDIVYGVLLLALAILGFVLRYKLANYKPDSLKFVMIFYSISAGVPFLYSLLISAITGQSLAVQAMMSLAIGVTLLFCNIKYFKNRAHLFIDRMAYAQPYYQFQPQTPVQYQQAYPDNVSVNSSVISAEPAVVFCSRCGTKLHFDSTFCHKCGTRIATDVLPSVTVPEPSPVADNCDLTETEKKSTKKPIIFGIIIGVLVAITVVLAVFLVARNGSDVPPESSVPFKGEGEEVSYPPKTEYTLVVALEPDFYPYSWVEDGEIYGLHVDIAKEVAARNGFSIKFVATEWEDLFTGIADGTYNLVLGIEPTADRQEVFSDVMIAFTDVYYDGMAAIYNVEEFSLSFGEWSNFKFTIRNMVEDGTIESYLSKYGLN